MRRELVSYHLPATIDPATLSRIVGRLLDAAAELRAAGEPVTMGGLLLKVAV